MGFLNDHCIFIVNYCHEEGFNDVGTTWASMIEIKITSYNISCGKEFTGMNRPTLNERVTTTNLVLVAFSKF